MTDPERWLDDPALPKQLRNALTERVRATELPHAVRRRVGVRLAVATGAVLGGSLLAGQAAAANLTAGSGASVGTAVGVGKVSAAKLALVAKLQGLGGVAGWVTSSVIVGAIGAVVLVDQVTTEGPSPSEMSIHVQAPEKTMTRSKPADPSHPRLAVTTVPSEATTAAPEPPPDGLEPPSRDAPGERALPSARPLPVQGAWESATSPEKEVEPAAASAAAPRDEDALGREVDELRAASRALGVSPQKALELVERHRQKFPRSQLATERRVLELRALLALGQTASAQRLGRALLDDRGAALYHQRVRRLLAATGDPVPEATP